MKMTAASGRMSRQPSRWWASLARADRRALAGMAFVIVALHVVGFALLSVAVGPGGLAESPHPVFTGGVGVLAYTFGLRHAFDADHIAAIDNTTRKLLTERAGSPQSKRPLSVGFWFSLGYSTIVFGLAVLLSVGIKALAGQIQDDGSNLHRVTGIVGASVSGSFLRVLGLVNLSALLGILRVLREARAGRYNEADLELRLGQRGLMNRILGGLTRSVRKP